MSEERMIKLAREALAARGLEDGVLAVGEFNPRGHAGGTIAGGLAGDEASGARIELEGNRLPVTHTKDVIGLLG